MKKILPLSLIILSFLIFTSCNKKEASLNAVKSGMDFRGKSVMDAQVFPSNGSYKITAATTYIKAISEVVEVTGTDTANNAGIQQNTWGPNAGQEWNIVNTGGTYYKIINIASGKALEVPNGSTTPGTQLDQHTYNGGDAQLWQMQYLGYGAYRIVSKLNGLCITLDQNSTAVGAKITQTAPSYNSYNYSQYWIIQDMSTLTDVPSIDNSIPTTTITWDDNSVQQLSTADHQFSWYGRVHRTSGNNLLLTYQFGKSSNIFHDSIAVRRSSDNGAMWSAPFIIKPGIGYGNISGPETCVLQNGWIVMAYACLGIPDDNAHDNVQTRISKDGGLTWTNAAIVAYGRSWEPAIIQLPSGQIEIFYSSEAAWFPSSNVLQQILMARSIDGLSWSVPKSVAFTPNARDGMPVPLILQNNKGMVFSIETVSGRGPSILWSSMNANWDYPDLGSAANGRRWLATPSLPWGGGPYIIQLPTGETILHSHGNRAVSIGNSIAKNFTNTTYPWANMPTQFGSLNPDEGYASLFMLAPDTIVAITRLINNTTGGAAVYWKKGHINR